MPLGSHNRTIGEVFGAVYRFALELSPWSLKESSFDLTTGAQHVTQRRIFADAHTEEHTLTRFHYTLAELIKLGNAAGLTVRDVYGDWQLNSYTSESPRTMLVTRKDI